MGRMMALVSAGLLAAVMYGLGRGYRRQYRADCARYLYMDRKRIEDEIREDRRQMEKWYSDEWITIEAADDTEAVEKLLHEELG